MLGNGIRIFWTVVAYAFFTLAPAVVIAALSGSMILAVLAGVAAFMVTLALDMRGDT